MATSEWVAVEKQQGQIAEVVDSLVLKDVRRLGVTLEVAGRAATSGFCTIWVEPLERRRFRN